jgi:4-amino-4-deoxy-L-arabinose transferase-like glycosyltransferase
MINHEKILIIIIFFYGISSLVGVGSWGAIETSEARYAEISREMFRSGDWLHPTLLDIHHYHKPPLTYWITATGYALFGVNETGARFFLQICFLIQLLLVYRTAAIILDNKMTALYAAVIYGAFPMVLTSVRGLTTDAYLSTFILASIFFQMQWRDKQKYLYLYLNALSLALCFLTKGPVGLLIPLLVMIGIKQIRDRQRFVGSAYHHVIALIIFILIAFSWFIYLAYDDEQFVQYFLFRHTLDRFANADVFTRTQPWWYFICFAPLLAMPWILIVVFSIKSKENFSAPLKRIIIFWILIPLIFFSFSSSKLVLYVLPVYGGLAVVCAACLENLKDRIIKFENTFFYFVTILLGLIAIGLIFVKQITPWWTVFFPLIAICIMAVIKFKKNISDFYRMPRLMLYSLTWSGFLILFSTFVFSKNELMVNSTTPIAKWITTHNMRDKQIIVYDKLLPSLAFDLDKSIISINDGNRYLNREIQFEHDDHWKNFLYNLQDPQEQERLRSTLQKPSVIVSKGDIKPGSDWIVSGFKNKIRFGKWIVFYNDK